MASPFPGMDPYLEFYWRDVHQQLAVLARRDLNRVLPGDLVARMDERPVVDHDIEYEQETHTEPFVTITGRDGGHVVTVIEFLSPTNKQTGPGREEYRTKRTELRASRIHVVEIDLVRAGSWRELLAPVVAPANVETAYRAILWRVSGEVALYPMPLRKRLPAIPIPLRATDKDVVLDLQPLVDEVYVNGRYDGTNYRKACVPALEGEDAAWAAGVLKEKVG